MVWSIKLFQLTPADHLEEVEDTVTIISEGRNTLDRETAVQYSQNKGSKGYLLHDGLSLVMHIKFSPAPNMICQLHLRDNYTKLQALNYFVICKQCQV